MSQAPLQISADFAPCLQPLFMPRRYKVLYGGRGAGRSWGAARALLLRGIMQPERVLCGRELQASIKDSVHKLLADQITLMGMNYLYEVQQASIKTLAGFSGIPAVAGFQPTQSWDKTKSTEFSFEGIRHNTTKIKSYEGVNIFWGEEAEAFTETSIDIIVPTIRRQNSELWFTFNPRLETDPIFDRFVTNRLPEDREWLCKMTYRDNPWFPEDLRLEMEEMKAKNFDKYLHIWEGECLVVLEGVIFADEIREATAQGRITSVPYDRNFPVIAVFDLGRADHTSCWFVQKTGFEWHVIDFYQNKLKAWDHYLGMLQGRAYVYDTIFLPHDAKAKVLGSKTSIEEQTRAKFQNVVVLKRPSISDKINAGRTVFPNCYFDAKKCQEGLFSLKHYKYEIDATSGRWGQNPLHDEYSDAADAFCYFGMASTRRSAGDKKGFFGKLLPRSAHEVEGFEGMPGVYGGGSAKPRPYDWMK